MKKILVINRKNTDNLGDQAIGNAMVNLFSFEDTKVDHAEFCYINRKYSLNPDKRIPSDDLIVLKDEKSKIFLPLMKWKLQNRGLCDCLKTAEYDLVIIGGGELLQSNSIFPCALNYWVHMIHKKQPKTRIVLFGIGVTDNFTKNDYKEISSALKYVHEIYVRDEQSKTNLNSVFKRTCKVIPDVVFSADACNCSVSRKDVYVGITSGKRVAKYGLMGNGEEQYFQEMMTLVENIKADEPNQDIKLLYTTNEDLHACRRFNNYIVSKGKKPLGIPCIHSVEDYMALMSKALKVYSPRMHGCILCEMGGGTAVPVLISPKMKSYEIRYANNPDLTSLHKQLLTAAKEVINC